MEFETLHETYANFFNIDKSYEAVFYMALDTEWHQINESKNRVLSYQIAISSKSKTINFIEYVKNGQRLRLEELVKLGLKGVADDISQFKTKDLLIILISHNFVAEWSSLEDRDSADITRNLKSIRKSIITLKHPIQLTIEQSFNVDVQIFDTMLLAPASHMSLKKLSVLLGSEDLNKEDISQHYKENMNELLKNEPEVFESYALQDSKITLMLFFLLQNSLNILVYKRFKKRFKTLASAGVKSFETKNAWFRKYKADLRNLDSNNDNRVTTNRYKHVFWNGIIKRSYFGGRNESYFIGDTRRHPDTKNKIWIDIDFSGCYPTAMALCPQIDVNARADYIPVKYELDEVAIKDLRMKNIPDKMIEGAAAALSNSIQAFDKYLKDMQLLKKDGGNTNKKGAALAIRKRAEVVDNRLIDKWYTSWKNSADNENNHIIPGFARIRFKFPEGTHFPCLPVKHNKYGLIYPLEGETTVPSPEILMALDAGATIEALSSIELPVAADETGEPIRFILPHLKELIKERALYKKDKDNPVSQVYEKLLKEFMNSLYGKFSQAINARRTVNIDTGETKYLEESSITEPCTAALITSQARAALSAILIAIEKFNSFRNAKDRVTVISATTDGLLMGIPVPDNYGSVEESFYHLRGKYPSLNNDIESKLSEILKEFGMASLLDGMNKYHPIRQMRESRLNMTDNSEILEIKHIVDYVISIKTRGQIGYLNSGFVPLLAKFGLKPPLSEIIDDPEEYKRVMETGGILKNTEEAKWILRQIEETVSGKIETYKFINLNTIKDMIKSNGTLDLVKKVKDRKINFDYDWKRKLIFDANTESHNDGAIPTVSPFSVPYKNIETMIRFRDEMESIRRTGYISLNEDVIHRQAVKGRRTRARGGNEVTVTRQLLRGITQDIIKISERFVSYESIADAINRVWEEAGVSTTPPKKWNRDDLKNAKRGEWESGVLRPTPKLVELLQKLADGLEADVNATVSAIFAFEEYHESAITLISEVISAVCNAHKQGIEPFNKLHEEGLLPNMDKIKLIFGNQINERIIHEAMETPFYPGRRDSKDFKTLKKLLYSLGIPNAMLDACARILAPKTEIYTPKPIKKISKTCLRGFISVIHQHDITGMKINSNIIMDNLSNIGLTKKMYYKFKSERFTPNSIIHNKGNQAQIELMAKKCGFDPAHLIDVMLQKK